ncbi:MAG TPA: hypothetical protein VF543_03230 [Pyrinomonadaceae bacterium]|jgi:hypothetical protein
MKKVIIIALFLIMVLSTATGFVLQRSTQPMAIKMHAKDLPQHGLTIITPADPSFDGRLASVLKGKPNEVVDNLKPFSVFVENRGKQTVVAYLIQWCFTREDGTNDCYNQAVVNPRALMEGEDLPSEYDEQTEKIKPNAARFCSIVSPDSSGPIRFEISRNEAERIKAGERYDRQTLLQRFRSQLATNYSDITITIDGAFFDDGTFVGPDNTGFFAQTKAAIDAKRDLLNEIASGLTNPGQTKDDVFKKIEATADQPNISLDSSATPTDFYNFNKKLYATEILQMRKAVGNDAALTYALRSIKKPWRKLQKKQD